MCLKYQTLRGYLKGWRLFHLSFVLQQSTASCYRGFEPIDYTYTYLLRFERHVATQKVGNSWVPGWISVALHLKALPITNVPLCPQSLPRFYICVAHALSPWGPCIALGSVLSSEDLRWPCCGSEDGDNESLVLFLGCLQLSFGCALF